MTLHDEDFSNKTRYGIESDALRYTWAGYYLFVILSSLIGDSTILVASLKYKAIKLHRVIVAVIHNIAVCDLLVVTLQVLPTFATIIADKWVFGDFLCHAFIYAAYYLNQASILLISTMTTSKLLLLKYPLRFGTISSRRVTVICGACWGIAPIFPVTMLLVDGRDVFFSYVFYTCAYGFSLDRWHNLRHPLRALLAFLPICLVVVTSIYLLVVAKNGGGRRLRWQGTVTAILTATVFCISLLPFFMMKYVPSTSFKRIAISFLYLNTMSNFFIYSLTVASFGNFVRSRSRLLTRSLTSLAIAGKVVVMYCLHILFLNSATHQ